MPEPPKSNTKTTHFRWVIVGLAAFITIVNYLDRSALSYTIGPLKAEFALNDQDFGLIASAFGVGYMVMTFLGGVLVDRLGARRVWTIAATSWSAMTMLLGLSTSMGSLLVLRSALGLAEGPNFPALARVVTDWLPVKERARATALGLTAVPLASVIGAPLISALIVSLGWRAMFFVLGALGIGWSLVWLALFRDYPENSKFVASSELAHIREGLCGPSNSTDDEIRAHRLKLGSSSIRSIVSNPSLVANNYAFFAFGYLLFFAVNWLPGYLQQTYKTGLQETGYLLIVPWATSAVLLSLAGCLSDWLLIRTGSRRIARSHMIWICQLVSALCFIPVCAAHSLALSICFLSLGLGIGLMPNAAFYALNSDLAGDRAGTSLGIMTCCSGVASILAPALTGYLCNATGSFSPAFVLLIVFTLSSVAGIVLFQHPDIQVRPQDGTLIGPSGEAMQPVTAPGEFP